MTTTTNYAWPLIAESQNQKYQTHNDALEAIDTIVYALSSSSGLTSINAGTGITVSVDSPPSTVTISADTSVLATHAYIAGLGYGSGSGSVTSVAMTVPGILSVSGSPVTTSGTLALSLATQTANLVFAGPTTGSAAAPTFRALVAADLPAGVGTVTSVAMTVPGDLSIAGSPVTTTGTLAITRSNQNANLVLAGPSTGSAATPAYRALVAADLPTQPYDIGMFAEGVLTTSEVIGRFVVPRALSLASGASGVAICGTAPTSTSAVITLAKNGSSIGTVTYSAAATTGTVSITSLTTFVSGDIITFTGPSSVNSTFADPSITLTATR